MTFGRGGRSSQERSSEISLGNSGDLRKLLPTAARRFGVFEQSPAGAEVLQAFRQFQEFAPQVGGKVTFLEQWQDKIAYAQAKPPIAEEAQARRVAASEATEALESEEADSQVQTLESELAWWRSQEDRLRKLATSLESEIRELQYHSKATSHQCQAKQSHATEQLRLGHVLESATVPPPSSAVSAAPNSQLAGGRLGALSLQATAPLSARSGRTPRDLRSSRLRGTGTSPASAGLLRNALLDLSVDTTSVEFQRCIAAKDDQAVGVGGKCQQVVGRPTGRLEASYREEIRKLQDQIKAVRSENLKQSRDGAKRANPHARLMQLEDLFLLAISEARRDLPRMLATRFIQVLDAAQESASLQALTNSGEAQCHPTGGRALPGYLPPPCSQCNKESCEEGAERCCVADRRVDSSTCGTRPPTW